LHFEAEASNNYLTLLTGAEAGAVVPVVGMVVAGLALAKEAAKTRPRPNSIAVTNFFISASPIVKFLYGCLTANTEATSMSP